MGGQASMSNGEEPGAYNKIPKLSRYTSGSYLSDSKIVGRISRGFCGLGSSHLVNNV